MKILVIAQNTFRETVRDRILWIILALSSLIILTSQAIAEIALGERTKVIADLSLGAMDLFGAVLCIFIGSGLLHREMEKRTLYTILTRPVSRQEFILGKYLGINATILASFLLMGTLFCVYFLLNGGKLSWIMFGAIFLLFLELILFNAIGIFFSTILSPITNTLIMTSIFIIGRASYEIKYWAEEWGGIIKIFLNTLYYLLPNFTNFNIKMAAVHNEWKAISTREVTGDIFFWDFLYCLLYSALMLYFAIIIFHKKNL